MAGHVDLYDNAYARAEHEVYRQVRAETYGRDLGQTSWVSAAESESIPDLLKLTGESSVLEIGCGSGMYTIELVRRVGCEVVGLDLNPHGIATATQVAAAAGLDQRVRFEQCDASEPLRFRDASFDAAFANDVLCHIPGRPALLRELYRVIRPGGRVLFSDALVIAGLISHAEIAVRSSIGPYFFSPPGENERLLESAGFALLSASDTSDEAASIAHRWHNARERRREELGEVEGVERYEGLQRFLACVHTLTSERRLKRFLYLAEKAGSA